MSQTFGRSRRQDFEDIDRPNLRPLPEKPYEYADRKTAIVNIDYHVEYDKHLYSVPHTMLHQEVDIHATERSVEIFHKGKSISIHPRNFRPGRFSTLREDMPPNHQFVDKVNSQQMVQWVANIGSQTAALVSSTLKSRPFPQQAYRSCPRILSLAKKHNTAVMEQACQNVLEAKVFSYQAVKDELEWINKQAASPVLETLPAHENIRGNHYYQ